jgi:hypothetical protein
MDPKLNRIWMVLRVGLGAIAVVSGVDKFFNLLTYWPMYVSEPFAAMLPFSTQSFMYVVGAIEILVGLAILSKFTRVGAYVMSIWLVCISINLVAFDLYDLAVRDLAIALAAFSLAQLTEVLHGVAVRRKEPRATQRPAQAW